MCKFIESGDLEALQDTTIYLLALLSVPKGRQPGCHRPVLFTCLALVVMGKVSVRSN